MDTQGRGEREMKPVRFELFKTALEGMIVDESISDKNLAGGHGLELMQIIDEVARKEGKDFFKCAYEFFISDWNNNEAEYIKELDKYGICEKDIDNLNRDYRESDR